MPMTTLQRRPRVVCVPSRPIEANVPIGPIIGSIGPSAPPTSGHRGVSTPTSQPIDRPVRPILDQSDRNPLFTRAPMNGGVNRVTPMCFPFEHALRVAPVQRMVHWTFQ